MQLVEPGLDTEPVAQDEQVDALNAYCPATHCVQLVEPAVDTDPVAQDEQVDALNAY